MTQDQKIRTGCLFHLILMTVPWIITLVFPPPPPDLAILRALISRRRHHRSQYQVRYIWHRRCVFSEQHRGHLSPASLSPEDDIRGWDGRSQRLLCCVCCYNNLPGNIRCSVADYLQQTLVQIHASYPRYAFIDIIYEALVHFKTTFSVILKDKSNRWRYTVIVGSFILQI